MAGPRGCLSWRRLPLGHLSGSIRAPWRGRGLGCRCRRFGSGGPILLRQTRVRILSLSALLLVCPAGAARQDRPPARFFMAHMVDLVCHNISDLEEADIRAYGQSTGLDFETGIRLQRSPTQVLRSNCPFFSYC